MPTPHDIAERLFDEMLTASPFAASALGVPGHEAEVEDASAAGEAALLERFAALQEELDESDTSSLSAAERITADCVRVTVDNQRASVESALVEHAVTPMPYGGPAVLLAIAARTVIQNASDAADYVTRLRGSGVWIDQISERLREGAAKKRLPVAALVEQTINWADHVLADDVPAALLAPQPPEGWDGASAWRDDVAQAGAGTVKPALGRWRNLLAELLPQSRSDTDVGLVAVPNGEADYLRQIKVHTTLDLTPQELHDAGNAELAALEARMLELGATLGLTSLPQIHQAMRESAAEADTATAIEQAAAAIRRAEAVAGEMFRPPLPPPCVISSMPTVVADSGAAPHYSPPRDDGGRPGTYWFNTRRATAGTGWDLEVVAFHEAVPGHHMQLSRARLLDGLPRLQGVFPVTAYAEGWGLYSEQLAGEVGLYADVRAEIGAIAASLMRAARLVLDTGIHAFGWSRQRALEFADAHVPMPSEFMANEVDRYIVMPGQALAYQTGKFEILRLREQAKQQLGATFDLAAFHGSVLDHGSVPLPALRRAVEEWIVAVRNADR